MSSRGPGQHCPAKGYASRGLSISILTLDFPLHHELPIQGDFAHQGTRDSVRRRFWFSTRSCYWFLVGRGQGCWKSSYRAKLPPQCQQGLRLRWRVLVLHQGHHCAGQASRQTQVFGKEAASDPKSFPRIWPLLEVNKKVSGSTSQTRRQTRGEALKIHNISVRNTF